MFCPECGAPNEDDAVYCGNCGAPMDPDTMPALESDEQSEMDPLEELDVEAFEEAPDELREEQALPAGELSMLPAPPKPPPPPPPPVARTTTVQTSGMAIASLVMGIAGWTLFPLLGSILAIVLGYAARREIRQRPDQLTGDGMAIAGLVLGWLMVGLSVLGLIVGGLGLCFLISVSSSAVGY
jgi:uncharacterized Zn finger protein (UPF0148 family)